MEEYECWLVRVVDGSVVSKHTILATELEGELVEVATPEMPLRFELGCVMVMGFAADVAALVMSLLPPGTPGL